MSSLQILQHAPFEGPGAITSWAKKQGHVLRRTRLYKAEDCLPAHDSFDALVIMGGPMGVHDEVLYPWLAKEKDFIARALSEQKHVLGICLGAQLLAHTLGARVYKNAEREIGWLPITWHDEARASPMFKDAPSEETVFHWHGDTFDLPAGARHLASSPGCSQQAFLYGPRALALQFHIEITPEGVESLLHHCADDLADGDKKTAPYVQRAPAIRAETSRCAILHQRLFTLLDSWINT